MVTKSSRGGRSFSSSMHNLAFEVEWRLHELISQHGADAVMNSKTGKKLFENLSHVEPVGVLNAKLA